MATYKSKVDWWLLGIFVVAMAISLYASVRVVLESSSAAWLSLLMTVSLGIGLPLWLLLGTNYTLEPTKLLIRSGPFKWHVPIAGITSITPTSNLLSSPALSLDRIRIEYGRNEAIMISPRNKEQFLQDIEVLRRDTH